MTTVILAAGRQERWRRDTEPKQLLRVAGETLIGRMQRQASSRGSTPVVVTKDDRIAAEAAVVLRPDRHRWTLETLLCSSGSWAGDRVVVLLGDVVYSSNCLDEAFGSDPPVTFLLTKKGVFTEVVAASFSKDVTPAVVTACQEVVRRAEAERREARLFSLLRHMELNGSVPIKRLWIMDWTQDFDRPEDYDAFDQSLVDDLPPVAP